MTGRKGWRTEGGAVVVEDLTLAESALKAATSAGVPVVLAPGAALLAFTADGAVSCRECGASARVVVTTRRLNLTHEAGCACGRVLAALEDATLQGRRLPRRVRREYLRLVAAFAGRSSGQAS